MQLIDSSQALGLYIRTARKTKGLSQQLLGRLAGVRQATVSNIERGEGGVSLATIFRVLAALGLGMNLADKPGAVPAAGWREEW